jgi:hypothetical protein
VAVAQLWIVRPNMKWLSSLFGIKSSPSVPTLIDPDFGKISFDGEQTGIWQMHDDIEDVEHHARYGFSAIPGDRSGPYPKSRAFLLQKKKELAELWRICTPALEQECERWRAKGLKKPVEEQFVLSSISIDEDYESSGEYEVGFESEGKFWVYVAVTVKGGKIVSHTCDT